MNPSTSLTRRGLALAVALHVFLGACSHSSPSVTAPRESAAVLRGIDYGRLVDVYAYRRIDPARADRRDTRNRTPVLIRSNVLVRPDVETQSLFDTHGNARLDADYRFMPFDVAVGHDQLLILWDDRLAPEAASFSAAMSRATSSLPELTAAWRGQNTNVQPIPVLPRNAALRLRFDRDLGVDSGFFSANPEAVQVLQFLSLPGARRQEFEPVPVRILADGADIIVDTSIVGGEARGGRNFDGLPPSLDRTTANMRIALPTTGPLSKVIAFAEDAVTELNGIDQSGESAVIRDFRSGNLADGSVAALLDVEPPMVVGHVEMGITEVDLARRVLTLNKRNHDVAVRGRIPYVDGALDPATDLPGGPTAVPAVEALRSGDVVIQEVQSPDGERVRIRAEVVMNLDVGNTVGDPQFEGLGMYRKGSDPSKPADGGQDPFVRVQVTNVTARDSKGGEVTFTASALPLGQDCEVRVHYYQRVEYVAQHAGALTEVSDRARMRSFLEIDPAPPPLDPSRRHQAGRNVDPMASIALRFSEPMNLQTIDQYDNFVLTNWTIGSENAVEALDHPKIGALSLLATRLIDHSGDGTLIQLRPPLGHFHVAGSGPANEEVYWLHMLLGARAPQDMAGNPVDVFDRGFGPAPSFSVSYSLRGDAATNAVGSRVHRFLTLDEDGTPQGSVDMFGQFQLLDGELRALPTSRFSVVADAQTMSGVTRWERGECDIGTPPNASVVTPAGGGVLYLCPSMISTAPPGGGMTEPLNPRGSRLQLTYREDDFGLSYTDPTRHLLDVEQMHWASFNDQAVRFDVFDRVTIRLGHSDWRPDMTYLVSAGACVTDCFAGRSGLRSTFALNVLQGSELTTVVKDALYEVNPNDAFRAPTGTKFVPYPRFGKTYTWRDPRLIRWDAATQTAIGLGGAHQPAAPVTVRDTTASISSPYVPNKPLPGFQALHANTDFVYDFGDFIGFRSRDHSPIALPLLVDFSTFPEGPQNGGFAHGTNLAHTALVGPCWPGSGYYNTANIPGCTTPWPETRAQASGGKDLITGNDILIEPETQATAQASNLTDSLLGDPNNAFLFVAPPKDGHVHWAQADMVRRVSMVTFGFFDTQRPNAHAFQHPRNPLTNPPPWAGMSVANGIPDLTGLGEGVRELVTMMDPPLSDQPAGTSVVVEYRGAQTLTNAEVFNQSDDSDPTLNWTSVQLVQRRNNLLNPLYACEAFRYAMVNELDLGTVYHPTHSAGWLNGPRVPVEGLTDYVTGDRLDDIRRSGGLLPRYLNYRIVMENNTAASPPVSPRLRSFAVAFRMGKD